MSHHYSGPDFGFPHGDARLDFTDLYAFPKPGDSTKSIFIMNVHPSASQNPPGPTTAEPFAPEALYELKIDTDGDAVADIAYRVRFSYSEGEAQTATLRRVEGAQAAATGDGGLAIVERAPVSTGPVARVTEAGDYRFFAGWRSDPFFCDVEGAKNNLQFTGDDFFADKQRTTCNSPATISSPTKMCAASFLKSPTLPWARTRFASGPARCAQAREAAGSRRNAERGLRKLSSLSMKKETTTWRENRPTTHVSFPASRTRSSTPVDIRLWKQSGSQRHCSQISCPMIPRVRRHFPTTVGHLPTTPSIPSFAS